MKTLQILDLALGPTWILEKYHRFQAHAGNINKFNKTPYPMHPGEHLFSEV